MTSRDRDDSGNHVSFPTHTPHVCNRSCAAPFCPYMYDPGPEIADHDHPQGLEPVQPGNRLPLPRSQARNGHGALPGPLPGPQHRLLPARLEGSRRGRGRDQNRGHSGRASYAGISRPLLCGLQNPSLRRSPQTTERPPQHSFLQVPDVDTLTLYSCLPLRGVANPEPAVPGNARSTGDAGSTELSRGLSTLSIRSQGSPSQGCVCWRHLFCL